MPLYYEPVKKKRTPFILSRSLRFSLMLVLLGSLLSVVAPLLLPAFTENTSGSVSSDFPVLLEIQPGAADMTDELLLQLADALTAVGIAVSTHPVWDSTVAPSAALVVWTSENQAGTYLTLRLAPHIPTVSGNVAMLTGAIVPREVTLKIGLNSSPLEIARLINALRLYHTGAYAAAGEALAALLRGTTPAALYQHDVTQLYYCNTLFRQGKYAQVLAACSRPNTYGWNYLLSLSLYQTGDYLAAWGYNFPPMTQENAAVVYFYRGKIAEKLGLYTEALALYRQALDLPPARERLTDLESRLQNQFNALPLPDTTTTTDTYELYMRALGWLHRQDYEPALTAISTAIELQPGMADFYNLRGYIRKQAGDASGALADFDMATRLAPSAYAYMSRGYLRAQQGEHNLAVADFDIARRLDPGYAGIDLAQGLVEQARNPRSAARHFLAWTNATATTGSSASFIGQQAQLELRQGHLVYLTIKAKKGDKLALLAAAHNSYTLDPLLLVLDSNRNPLTGNDDRILSQDFNAEITDFVIPADGTYHILVTHAGGGSEGTLTLTYSLETNRTVHHTRGCMGGSDD